jgi:hypothetical protein
MTRPPHLTFLAELSKARVDYVVIGLMGLNHYAATTGDVYHTEDLDVLISPQPSHLRRACTALVKAGYELHSNGEPLPAVDAFLARRILERRAVVRGSHPHGLGVDLVLEARPFSFAQWKKGRCEFRADRVRIHCAAKEMILRAKEEIGRPKDKAFLKLYKAAQRRKAA